MRIETLGRSHQIKKNWTTIAGPCAAENPEQIMDSAKLLAETGVHILRAGIWKPRTSSDSWQGVGREALEWMRKAKEETGIAIATEVKDAKTLEDTLKAEFDVIWIGSRNGLSYSLLEEVGKQTIGNKIPIILKRNMGADLKEWLGAAGYILKYNPNVILCERGIKGFPKATRNVLDLQTAKLAQLESGLPVIIDVSHAAGRCDLIIPMALAAKAAGFDGLMVEVHPTPDKAKTDSRQQISIEKFAQLMTLLKTIPDNLVSSI